MSLRIPFTVCKFHSAYLKSFSNICPWDWWLIQFFLQSAPFFVSNWFWLYFRLFPCPPQSNPLSHYHGNKFTEIQLFDTKVPLAVNPILVATTWLNQSNTLYCSLETKAVFCASLELAPDPCGLRHVRRSSAVPCRAQWGLHRDTVTNETSRAALGS